MKILIETPTWLGDSVMTTPAIENIIASYPNAKLTIFGTMAGVAIFKDHPNIEQLVIDNSRTAIIRPIALAKIARSLGDFDRVFSFRRQFSSRLFVFFAQAKLKYNYQRYNHQSQHQVLRYNAFINKSLRTNLKAGSLKIYNNSTFKTQPSKLLGINPGASYGSAKRWYPQEFAKVAIALSKRYDIIIFGSKAELDIAYDIEKALIDGGIKNYQNLAGKTSIDELIEKVVQLDLFITSDSGPMHLAAAFSVPTIAIFGPTKDSETSQWMNEKSVIVKENFDCQPCMQRICPLKGEAYHQCMKNINAQKVLTITKDLGFF